MIENAALGLAVTDTALASASAHVAPAPAVTSAIRAPMIEYGPSLPAGPAPVTDHASTSPAGAYAARAPVPITCRYHVPPVQRVLQ